MNFKQFGQAIVKFTTKNSPYILSGIGATAITIGTVVIVKKARRADVSVEIDVSDRIEEARCLAKTNLEEGNITEKQSRKMIVKAYAKGAVEYTKYYAAPVLLISGGVLCMFSGMLIQTKRLKVMSAAYTALAASFNDYRGRVKKALGEEKENDIFHGIERDKDGKIIKQEAPIDEKYKENEKTFSRLFGDGNSIFWQKNTKICLTVLKGAEATLNQLLRYQGYVTLNDVWKELGMKPSEEGMYLGWRWKYGDPVYGETYIDLGFAGPKNEERCDYLRNAWNEEIWIDLVPPHTLFGKLPKEIIRTQDEKDRIRRNRRKVVSVE